MYTLLRTGGVAQTAVKCLGILLQEAFKTHEFLYCLRCSIFSLEKHFLFFTALTSGGKNP
jgi:hypothetical protein